MPYFHELAHISMVYVKQPNAIGGSMKKKKTMFRPDCFLDYTSTLHGVMG